MQCPDRFHTMFLIRTYDYEKVEFVRIRQL